MILSRVAILAAQDIKTQTVECPEWGGDVLVKGFTLAEADKWRKSIMVKKESRGPGGKTITEYVLDTENAVSNEVVLVTLGAVDEAGAPLFTADDVEALMLKSSAPVKRLAKAILSVSGLTPEAAADAEKN